jgi:hypothetical protein
MNLRARVVHCSCLGNHHWYADIDDAEDPQPDDPFWYRDCCASQAEALAAACAELSSLTERLEHGAELNRILEADYVDA